METNDRRYLKCPAAITISLLKKFIRMKYGLQNDYRVDLLYNGVRDKSLESDLTLLDVAFIFKWNKNEPMRFHYRIFDRTVKSLPTRAGKRTASSMMDEPPDDDAASGPHNRPPMTSASPSSKLPRVSNSSSTGANTNSGRTGGSARTTTTHYTSAPIYDFSEGNSDTEEPILQTGKLKLRGFRRENNSASITANNSNSKNSNNNNEPSSKTGSQALKRSPSNLRSSVVENRRSSSSGKTASPARSNSVGTSHDDTSEDAESDSSSSESDSEAKTAQLTSTRVRSAAQTVLANQVNGAIKLNMTSSIAEKREPLRLALGSVTAKSLEHKHKHKHHHKMKHKKKHKPLKISLSLNPSSHAGGNNRGNVNQSQKQKSEGVGGVAKIASSSEREKGSSNNKLISGQGQSKNMEGSCDGPSGSANSQSNFPVNVKPTTSAHLSNISKSISVSIGVGNNNNSSTATASQSGKKGSTSTNLLSKKNSGIEVQPTTISAQATSSSNPSSNSNQFPTTSTSRSHPLLPESVHVPKSVTLIPVNPSGMRTSSVSDNVVGGGRSMSSLSDKSGSGITTSNRMTNANTFTHSITNKSLHQIPNQITVTEVPPPPKSGSSSPASGGTSGGINVGSATNSSGSNNSSSGPSATNNPIEKVIAASHKPQFSGPGSMEITKIYCNTTKENPTTKKLKERKGLDISITVPGMSSIKDKKTHKLEETLRQKMGLNSSSTAMTMSNNKITKGSNQTQPVPLFNAKMPPGITIGPAGVTKNSISGNSNSNSNTSASASNSGSTIAGLGFTLPPHITAHPQHPPAKQQQMIVVGNHQMKQGGDKSAPHKNLNISGPSKGSSQIGVVGAAANKERVPSGGGVTPKGLQTNKIFDNRKQLGEALASMMDMANRNTLKSPSPPKNCQQTKEQHKSAGGTSKLHQPNINTNSEKRSIDMSSSSSSRKNSRGSPEPKRSKTNESSSSSSVCNPKGSANESPLDLSGTGRTNSRPNSNSSSPIHHHSVKTVHSNSSPSSQEKVKHNENMLHANNNMVPKKSPTSLPKVSPPSSLGKSSGNKGSGTPTGSSSSSSSISSIVQNLAQKQLHQQQHQKEQSSAHNQIMHLQQGLQNMHAASNLGGGNPHSHPHSHLQAGKGGSTLSSLLGNSLSPKGLNSISPPMTTMPNSSPPNTVFDPLRNLLTLSDAAVAARHGKVHPAMNSLMSAVGLCSSPYSHHAGLSPTSVTSGSLFPQLASSLAAAAAAGGKSPGGMFDPAQAYLAAISAHNERLAAVAGMSQFHSDSMSPPMSMASSFSQVRPSSNSPHNHHHGGHGGLRIPPSSSPVQSKTGGSNNNYGKNSNNNNNHKQQQGSSPTSPLSFAHPPPAPRSPSSNKTTNSSSASQVSSSSSHSKSHDSSSNMKNSTATTATTTTTRINGTNTFFNNNHLPILPPGIHNPLLPTYPRSPTTTNLVSSSSSIRSQSPISLLSSSSCITNNATAKSTSSSDKKGIPNSMKISNFLPSKPKGQDNSNVEATITSGSNVGGGASLTKFLSDISPPSILVTQAAQSNLSVSPATTLPKDVPSSRGFVSTLHNKSSNEQECLSKSDSKHTSPSSNVVSSSSTFFKHNPIKVEPAEKPIILSSSNIQLKSNADPITCPTNASTPNKSGLKMNEEMAKSNSLEIKSEGATTLMSSSSPAKGGQFGLGLSPPAARTTTTSSSNQQPQNQAVRHIPNPALLFNRLNSCSPSSLVTSPTSETPNSGKSLPFKNQKSPVKLEEVVALQVPALPFPGVSVPVKVDVDSLLSIPISNTVKTIQPTEHCGLKPLTNPGLDETTEEKDNQTTTKKTEDNLLIAPSPNKEVDIKRELTAPLVSEQVKAVKDEEEEKAATNEISRSTKSEEEIVKIEYTTEDADLDIDIVGIETETPICPGSNDPATTFTPTESLESQSEKEIEQKTTRNSVAVVESSGPLEDIPSSSSASSSSQFVNEITAANTCDLNEPKKQDDKSPTPKYQHEHQSLQTDSHHINVTSPPSIVSLEETETILSGKPELQLVCASEIAKVTEVAKNDAEGVEKRRQDETEIRVVEATTEEEPTGEVETNLSGMEVQQQQKVMELAELLGKTEEDEKSVESGEMTGESVEMVDTQAAADTAGGVQVEKLQQLISSNKSAELQIEAMECEEEQVSSSSLTESIENHCMETTEQEKLVVDDEILMEEDDADEEMCIDAKEDSNSEIVKESENDDLTMLGCTLDHKLSQGHEFSAVTNSSAVAAPGIAIAVAQEQNLTVSTGATATTTTQDMVVDNNINNVAAEPSCENENADAVMSSDIQMQAEYSLSSCSHSETESNSTLNQISINPEVVVPMLDTNIMKSPRVEAAIQPTSSSSSIDSADEKEGTQTNTQPNNNNIDQALKEDDEAEKKKLMKSSSSSQLELNCPSADTNDIELSNPPVTIVANAQLSNSSSSISVGHVAEHIESPADVLSACKNVEEDSSKLTVEQCTSPSIGYVAEESPVSSSVENEKVEEICQNTAPVLNMEPADEFTIETSISHHKTDEESTAADPNVATTQVPDLCSSELLSLQSQLDDGDVEVTEIEPQLVETAPISPVPAVTFSLDNSRLISATATITTTTAELSNNVMEASSMESPISSRNSLESPTSPEDNIKKIETLEQVAAGLFATNTMNNNNNKSLTINAPTCDIAINTTSASDMATV
ncbi:Polycomb complex protein BMI-1 [Folsomia candida]|uniref:Polycomb complex protein BMI-1 n=1 Tax=Folsomia candida TaxID=158441 RepID=A0A226EJ74_FOLCA|nr:Polycomb complex protein BMI-1 [Folsomia candida]